MDEVTKNSVSLSWNRPSSDGGDKIQGYVIEYKKLGEHWTKYNDKPITELSAKGKL